MKVFVYFSLSECPFSLIPHYGDEKCVSINKMPAHKTGFTVLAQNCFLDLFNTNILVCGSEWN